MELLGPSLTASCASSSDESSFEYRDERRLRRFLELLVGLDILTSIASSSDELSVEDRVESNLLLRLAISKILGNVKEACCCWSQDGDWNEEAGIL